MSTTPYATPLDTAYSALLEAQRCIAAHRSHDERPPREDIGPIDADLERLKNRLGFYIHNWETLHCWEDERTGDKRIDTLERALAAVCAIATNWKGAEGDISPDSSYTSISAINEIHGLAVSVLETTTEPGRLHALLHKAPASASTRSRRAPSCR